MEDQEDPFRTNFQKQKITANEEDSVSPKSPEIARNYDTDSDVNDIPIVSYSDEDKSWRNEEDSSPNTVLQDSKASPIIKPALSLHKKSHSEPDDRVIDAEIVTQSISDTKTPRVFQNSDLDSFHFLNALENETLQKEKNSDVITNDIFYEILADIITNPIPHRDLSEFNLLLPMSLSPPQVGFPFCLIDTEKRKKFDLLAIEKYLEEVIESIMENESGFIDNLLEPVRKSPIDMLQLLQNSDLGSYEHFENISLKQPVLSLDLYLDIERNKEEKRLTEKVKEEGESEGDEELVECEQIHRKMIFD